MRHWLHTCDSDCRSLLGLTQTCWGVSLLFSLCTSRRFGWIALFRCVWLYKNIQQGHNHLSECLRWLNSGKALFWRGHHQVHLVLSRPRWLCENQSECQQFIWQPLHTLLWSVSRPFLRPFHQRNWAGSPQIQRDLPSIVIIQFKCPLWIKGFSYCVPIWKWIWLAG